jgi:hypothetical protein
MKKVFLHIALLISMLVITGCSSKHTINRTPDNIDSLNYIKQVEYERGYAKAQEENKDKWIDIGFKRAEQIIKEKWADKMKAYEAGKYARKKGYVTEPYIISIDNPNGTTTFKSLGCKIEKMLTPDELFDLYANTNAPKINDINSLQSQLNQNTNSSNGNPSVQLVDNHKYYNNNYVENTNDLTKTVNKSFSKTEMNRNILNYFGVLRNCTSNENSYQCTFKNNDVLKDFCNKSNICK